MTAWMNRLAGYLAAVGIVAASLFRLSTVPSPEQDVTGDARADVTDIQRILADVLLADVDESPSDLNDDGVVDVRDLQRMLADVAEADDSPESIPADANGDATLPPTCDRAPAPAFAVLSLLTCLSPPADEEDLVSSQASGFGPPTGTARYLYALTPNAPPETLHS